MKNRLLALFAVLLCVFTASAQVDTTKTIQSVNAHGYRYKNLMADSSMSFPQDTFRLKSTWRGIAFKGGTPYFWSGFKWEAFGTGTTTAPTLRFDSSYTPLGGNRGSEYIVKSVRFRVNNVTINPTQFGDSAAFWNFTVPTVYVDSFYRIPGKDSFFVRYAGGTVKAWKDSTGGAGGGSQDLQSVIDLGDSTTDRIVSSDTLKGLFGYNRSYYQIGDTVKSGKIWMIYGTSISMPIPTGLTANDSYTYLLAKTLGLTRENRAKTAGTVIQYSAGDSSLENKIYTIPVYNSGYGLLTIEGAGINDGYTPLGKPFDTTAAKAALNKFVDTCQARGWPNSLIAIISSPWTTSSQYPNVAHYNRAAQTVAESQGVTFIDMYTYTQTRGGYTALYDSIHPSVYGNRLYEANILKSLPNLKKVGFLNLTGGARFEDSLYVKDSMRIGDFTPTFDSYKLKVGGNVNILNKLRIGLFVNEEDNAPLQVATSTNQVAIAVGLGSNKARIYKEFYEITNGTSSVRLQPDNFRIYGNNYYFGGSGYNQLQIGLYGGVIINESGINTGDFRVAGDNQTHLLYTSATNDRVGIRTSSPDSILTVNGGLRVNGGARFPNLPSGKKAKQVYWDPADGTFYQADSTVGGGGSGGGTTYKIGTYNSQTPNGDGASIVGDSIYMQLFSSENPGLVPPGGTSGTYLKGDGTWGTIAGGTGYVDSVSNNAVGDSLIVIKGSNRYAYKYPSGTSGLTKGTTTIASSATGRLLYDSSGVLSNNANLTYNTSGELLLATATDNGNYKLQVGGDVVLTGGSIKLTSIGSSRIDYSTAAVYVFGNTEVAVGTGSSTTWLKAKTTGLYLGGDGTAAAKVHLAAGTATAGTAPLMFTSGTNLTTAVAGAVEYNGTNLFFTPSSAMRNSVLMASGVNSVSPTSPNITIPIVINGTTYYLHGKTTND